jgi:transposase
MSRVLRPDYSLRLLLPPSLDEWVPANHPVRFVRDFVDALDLAELGIPEPAAEEGRPPYGPDLLLKVWLFGYMERIRSTRALEKACLQVMPFLWLTGNLHPDHNTLWRFFNKHRAALPKLFKRLVKMAAEAELIGFVLHALDGTKLTAASSTDQALHRKSLVERLKHLDAFIASYMQEVNAQADDDKSKGYVMPSAMADEAARRGRIRAMLEQRIEDRADEGLLQTTPEPTASTAEQLPLQNEAKAERAVTLAEATHTTEVATSSPAEDETPPRDEEPPQGGGAATTVPPAQRTEPSEEPVLREAEMLKKELTTKLAMLDEAGVNHLHEDEPEARMMKGRGGVHALGYNAQIVVDHDSDMIVACDVVAHQNDLAQLAPMLNRVRETFGRVAKESVVDGGYGSGEQLKLCEASDTSVIAALREASETKGEYSKAHFRYDAQSNVYVCPQREQLVQIGANKSYATAAYPDAIYRCRNKTCPVLAQCTKDPLGRKVRRPYGEDARERQAEKQKDRPTRVLLSLRKEIVEHVFGIVKAVDGFRRFTVRGLEKAGAQWSLVCIAVNLRKLSAMAMWKAGKLTPLLPGPNLSRANSAAG